MTGRDDTGARDRPSLPSWGLCFLLGTEGETDPENTSTDSLVLMLDVAQAGIST